MNLDDEKKEWPPQIRESAIPAKNSILPFLLPPSSLDAIDPSTVRSLDSLTNSISTLAINDYSTRLFTTPPPWLASQVNPETYQSRLLEVYHMDELLLTVHN